MNNSPFVPQIQAVKMVTNVQRLFWANSKCLKISLTTVECSSNPDNTSPFYNQFYLFSMWFSVKARPHLAQTAVLRGTSRGQGFFIVSPPSNPRGWTTILLVWAIGWLCPGSMCKHLVRIGGQWNRSAKVTLSNTMSVNKLYAWQINRIIKSNSTKTKIILRKSMNIKVWKPNEMSPTKRSHFTEHEISYI